MEDFTNKLRQDALEIGTKAIKQMHPDILLKQHFKKFEYAGKLHILAIGKAAWTMANAAQEVFYELLNDSFVITKYHHSKGKIGNMHIREAGHPYPDKNSLQAASEVIEFLNTLNENDTVLLLISGGASALFEQPLAGIELKEIISINKKLLNSGADIHEINTVRKHLSAVKGGRLAEIIYPAKVISYILSDVIGDDLDVIASGPVHPDRSTSDEAVKILRKFKIDVSDTVKKAVQNETPKLSSPVETTIIGNVSDLCEKAAEISQQKGYKSIIIDDAIQWDVKQTAEELIEEIRKFRKKEKESFALIMGGETVVKVSDKGKGGRNQELALILSGMIREMENVVVLALASDGTDGPTDAAGGLVDGTSWNRIINAGIDPIISLKNNDSYNALKATGDLVITGPTGTNVNDLILVLSK